VSAFELGRYAKHGKEKFGKIGRRVDNRLGNRTQARTGEPALTPHQQQEARKRLAKGETQRSVARSYNVSQSTISRLAA
jgi:DNA invertase Pin-like site-specific DNA recombinase